MRGTIEKCFIDLRLCISSAEFVCSSPMLYESFCFYKNITSALSDVIFGHPLLFVVRNYSRFNPNSCWHSVPERKHKITQSEIA
jgi:hypothetical protein